MNTKTNRHPKKLLPRNHLLHTGLVPRILARTSYNNNT
uniref:Uncharacterized protein n=1 Tax=Arundo donax TaxID=35708 RepID=A0A0A9BRG4_ARUDO